MTSKPETSCELKDDEIRLETSLKASAGTDGRVDHQPDAIAELDNAGRDVERPEQMSTRPAYSVFSNHQKGYIVFMVAIGGFYSPLSANIYFPVLNVLARDLHVSNALINLTLTSYMILQAFSPTIFGDLGDMTGRRPAYVIGFIIYIAANIGLALQNNYVALLILRCVQSAGSSGTIALGNGVVGDIASTGERGKYMGKQDTSEGCFWDSQRSGIAQFGAMAAPAIAPVVGGIISQFLGWRWLFWFLTIMAVAYLIPFVILFPETGRNVVGNGSIPPQGWNMSVLNYLESRKTKRDDELSRTISRQEKKAVQAALARNRKFRWPNPLRTVHIVLEKDVGIILLFNSLIYTAFYDITASLPSLFAQIYDFNDLQIGYGAACVISSTS